MKHSSPLKGRIAFTATVFGFERIFEVDLESRQTRAIVDGPGRNSYPNWSPDGQALVFSSDRDGNREIYVSDWDGENQKRLTSNIVLDDHPSWSPDGKWIVFHSAAGRGPGSDAINIHAIRPDGSGLKAITSFKGKNTSPRWSPDGKRVAYVTDRFWPGTDICVWNLDHRLETCPRHGTRGHTRPMWSPKGEALGYSVDLAANHSELGIFNFADGSEEVLPRIEGREFDLIWSPSGKHLVFCGETETRDRFNLMIYDPESKENTTLLASEFSIRYPSWSEISTLPFEALRAKRQEQEAAVKP
jgi:Tol biopolymer transport system component